MREVKRFDFLTDDISTRELHARHHADSPAMIATLRSAVRGDSRPGVRQNAIVFRRLAKTFGSRWVYWTVPSTMLNPHSRSITRDSVSPADSYSFS